uniref:Uncharacterized protein n=1 Tax=Anguilla anguilla TaxID=7936 RepID=A0A0E9SZ64_ANGAN
MHSQRSSGNKLIYIPTHCVLVKLIQARTNE